MQRLAFFAAALAVTVAGLVLSFYGAQWLQVLASHHLREHWFALACSLFSSGCVMFGSLFQLFIAPRRKVAPVHERLTPLPPRSRRPL